MRLKDQFAERLAEGPSVIEPNVDLIAFMGDVDTLRIDVTRLHPRIERTNP